MNPFHPSRHPSRYDSRRDKRRIAGLVFTLGLVVICVFEAAKPKNWEWLTGPAPARNQDAADRTNRSAGRMAPGDDSPLGPGEVRILPSRPPSKPSAEPGAAESGPPEGHDLRIPRELLATIHDTRIGIPHDESEAYFTILALVRDVPLGVLERAARTDVTFAQMLNDPEQQRGRIVTLEGELRRLTELPAGQNDRGFETLYDGWMFTDEAGPTNPIRVICTGKPAGLPEGEQIRQRVRFTGYFFKRCGYVTAHGPHSAPLLLGKRFRWTPPSPRSVESGGYTTVVLTAIGLLAAGLAGVVWWFAAADRQLQASHLRRVSQPTRESIAALDRVETVDTGSFLERLSAEAQTEPNDPDHDSDAAPDPSR